MTSEECLNISSLLTIKVDTMCWIIAENEYNRTLLTDYIQTARDIVNDTK